ncbi:MAG TPA: histidine phosphatase family protein [Phototrophicaceae bacterium]|nr:histidine phosphatase family protein [Phototrophicaceae bacterium]
MLTILYSPHMTSVDNEAKRASGHADVPLSDAGRRQAVELGQQYADYALAAIFCSDLQRARMTAEIAFAERGLPIIADARLREYDYGDLTQHPVAEVEAQFPQRIDEPFPNGESLRRVVERVGAFLREILPEYDGKTVALIDHRATRYALEYWCGDQSLAQIAAAQWEWREVPIWRYEVDAAMLERRALNRS